MIYELGVYEERNTFFCHSNVLFQKKSKQGRLIELRRISSGQSSKEKRNFQGRSRKNHVNNLKSQSFLTSSPGCIFSEIIHYCCLGCHNARYITRVPTDQSTTYLELKTASYVNRTKYLLTSNAFHLCWGTTM